MPFSPCTYTPFSSAPFFQLLLTAAPPDRLTAGVSPPLWGCRTYTPAPSPLALFPVTVPRRSSVPLYIYTPPPLTALLPRTSAPPFIVNVTLPLPTLYTYTPPPSWGVLLPQTDAPSFIVNAALPLELAFTYTPPPFFSALLPRTAPPSIVNVPLTTYTPPPWPLLVLLLSLPLILLPRTSALSLMVNVQPS